MKILESQSATLTNYEVLSHIQSLRSRAVEEHLASTKNGKTRSEEPALKSSNYETVIKDLETHLTPNPSHHTPRPPPHYSSSPYTSPSTLPTLIASLKPYNLLKSEVLMIANLRPENVPQLLPIVEELDIRFSDEEQSEMLQIIGDVLGREEEGMGDEEGDGEGGWAANGHVHDSGEERSEELNGYRGSPEPIRAHEGEDEEMEEDR